MTAIDLVEGPSLERAATGEMRRMQSFHFRPDTDCSRPLRTFSPKSDMAPTGAGFALNADSFAEKHWFIAVVACGE
jgi:hypothetical protein